MLVAEMDDQHLSNTINLIIKTIDDLFTHLTEESTMTSRSKILYKTRMSKEEIEDRIKESTNALKEYIFEASLRGIHFTEPLQKVFDRKGAITVAPFAALSFKSSKESLDYEMPF